VNTVEVIEELAVQSKLLFNIVLKYFLLFPR